MLSSNCGSRSYLGKKSNNRNADSQQYYSGANRPDKLSVMKVVARLLVLLAFV